MAFSPDGSRVAAKSRDAVFLWDIGTWSVHATVTGSGADGIALALSAGGSQLATACADRTVRIWDTATGTARTVLADTPDTVPLMEFTPDGTGLLTVSNDGTVRRLDLAAPTAAVTGSSEVRWGVMAAVSLAGGLLATTADDGPESGTVRIWDAATGTERAVIAAADPWADPDDEYELRIPEAAFSPDGTLLATASMMGRTFLWDAATGTARATLTGHDRGWAVTAVAFSPDGTLIATGSLDWTARIWDVRDGTLRTTLTCDESVYTVAFSAEGTLLATVSGDRTIWIWDLATATARTVIRSSDWVSSATFLPGGRYLATATDTGTARIWDTSAGRRPPRRPSRSSRWRATATRRCCPTAGTSSTATPGTACGGSTACAGSRPGISTRPGTAPGGCPLARGCYRAPDLRSHRACGEPWPGRGRSWARGGSVRRQGRMACHSRRVIR